VLEFGDMIHIRDESVRELAITAMQVIGIAALLLCLRWLLPHFSHAGQLGFIAMWFSACLSFAFYLDPPDWKQTTAGLVLLAVAISLSLMWTATP
jgi:hypothetical protein